MILDICLFPPIFLALPLSMDKLKTTWAEFSSLDSVVYELATNCTHFVQNSLT